MALQREPKSKSPSSSTSPSSFLPDVAQAGAVGRVLAGMKAALAGVSLVARDSHLFVLALVPMAVHLSLFVAACVFGLGHVDDIRVAVVDGAPGAWRDVVDVVVFVAAAVGVVIAAAVGSVVVGSVVCDPFYDLLSERTEALLVGDEAADMPFSLGAAARGIVRELLANVLRFAAWLSLAVPLWLLSFTPLAIVATPLSLVWTWMFVAYEFLSRSLARHAVDPRHRFGPLFQNKALFVGFGAVAWLFSFIPFLAPFFVVAGTRLYLCLAVHQRAPSRWSR